MSRKDCEQVSCSKADRSTAGGAQKELIEEQEQRKDEMRKVTWGYSTAEQAKS
jgi:hypothetical protein